MNRLLAILFLLALLVPGFSSLAAEDISPGYVMRYPDIGGGQIVFTYEDDLWLVPAEGGDARRITSHPGREIVGKFSPDGKQLAFSASYDGGFNIYVMDVPGGVPRRLTYHPAGDVMVDWCPDGKGIYFVSRRLDPNGVRELYRVDVNGGMPWKFPVDRCGLACVAPDRSAVAYNRIGRQMRTWKRHEGGTAQDIWVAHFESGKIEKITDWTGTDSFPMWAGDQIYFISDRQDGTLNVFAYDTNNRETRPITTFAKYDVKYPSLGDGRIVFQHGPGLKVLDPASGQVGQVDIRIPSDRIHMREELLTPEPTTGSFGLSPGGERVLIEARGEILNYPAEDGDPVNLTRTSGSREKNAVWSPDGRWIAFVSDKSGEERIYLVDQRGEKEWRQLTDTFHGYTLPPVWSPDSKWLLFADKFMKLNLVDASSGKVAEIAHSDYDDAWDRWGIQDYAWSPDSRWIAYTSNGANMNETIYLYDTQNGKTHRLTDEMYTSWSPSFDPAGKYLYFLSNRTFNPIMGRQDQTHVFLKVALPYMVILQDGKRSPFYTEDVVVDVLSEEKDDDKKDDKEVSESEEVTTIDLEGLGDRTMVCVGAESGNYFRLEAIEGGFLMLLRQDPIFLKYQNVNDHTEDSLDLVKYTLEDEETETLLEGIANYHISADGEQLIYRSGSCYGVVAASEPAKVGDGSVDLSALKLRIDRLQEFPQIFAEAWRTQRDWFYDKNMHGVDWQGMYDKYAPFVKGCGTRGDLNYLIGEMIGELNIGHTYIFGGDFEDNGRRIGTGLLGASFVPEKDADFYRIADIVPGVPWDPRYRSPLTEPGISVAEGEYLIAIDGVEVKKGDNVYAHLVDKGGKMVTLTVNDKPEVKDARTVRVQTLRFEGRLRYRAWVDHNLDYVTEKTDGTIGYLHIPNMGEDGLVEFGRCYYPQTEKKAMIIDVRNNGGGFVSGMIIDRLERELWSMTIPREGKKSGTPERTLHGPILVLIDEGTGSDGENFAEAIKRMELGTVMGVRTWGGSIGYEAHQDLVDGGITTPPQFGSYGLDGSWPIEGWGVEPHIEVMNMPAAVVAGEDTQLEEGIAYLKKQLVEHGDRWVIPDPPAYPDKSKPRMSGTELKK